MWQEAIGDSAHYSYRFTVMVVIWLAGLYTKGKKAYEYSFIYSPIVLPQCTGSCTSQVFLFTGDRRMPKWQYFFFFVWGCLFVISHLMLTCKLLRARVTIADDSFVLSPLWSWLLMLWFSWNPLWLWHKLDSLENTLKAPVLEPVVSLEAVGDFGQKNCYCSATS